MLSTATAVTFRTLSSIRRARAFHPVGDLYEGTLTLAQTGASFGAHLLDRPGARPALIRLSRGIGLPEPMPDLLGLSVRVLDEYGPGIHQDFLFSSAGADPVSRRLLLPSADFLARTYSSVLPYRVGPRRVLFGAMPITVPARRADRVGIRDELLDSEVRFTFAVSSPFGRWMPLGEIALHRAMPADEGEKVSFDPWNTGGGIEPVGLLQKLRAPAYAGSRVGRA